jgi:hypothetical protein
MPALINQLIELDFTTQEGVDTGDLVQTALRELCNGNNFGWKYTTDPNYAYYDKKAAELWYRSWQQVVDNRSAWVNLGKLDEEAKAEFLEQLEGTEAAGEPDPEDVGSSDSLDDF